MGLGLVHHFFVSPACFPPAASEYEMSWFWEGLEELLGALIFWLVMCPFVLAVSFIVFAFGYFILGWCGNEIC